MRYIVGFLVFWFFVLNISQAQAQNPDWCYFFNYLSDDYGTNISTGSWVSGQGIRTDSNGRILLGYANPKTVAFSRAVITVELSATSNTPFTMSGSVFGQVQPSTSVTLDTSIINTTTFTIYPDSLSFDNALLLDLRTFAGLQIDLETIYLEGDGLSPFDDNFCGDNLPTETPTPTNTPGANEVCYNVDFTIDDGDFVQRDITGYDANPMAVYVNGVGWSYSDDHFSATDGRRIVSIQWTPPADIFLIRQTVTFNYTKGHVQNPPNPTNGVAVIARRDGGEISRSTTTIQTITNGTGKTQFHSVNATTDEVRILVQASVDINAAPITYDGDALITNYEYCVLELSGGATPTPTDFVTSTPNTANATRTPIVFQPTNTKTSTPTLTPYISPTPSITPSQSPTPSPTLYPTQTPENFTSGDPPGAGGGFDFFQAIWDFISGLFKALIDLIGIIWNIFVLLIELIFGLIGLLISYLLDILGRFFALVLAFFDAPSIPIDGLQQCVSAPLESEICAVFYVLDWTLFAPDTWGTLIIPIIQVFIGVAMVFIAIRYVLKIVRTGEDITRE